MWESFSGLDGPVLDTHSLPPVDKLSEIAALRLEQQIVIRRAGVEGKVHGLHSEERYDAHDEVLVSGALLGEIHGVEGIEFPIANKQAKGIQIGRIELGQSIHILEIQAGRPVGGSNIHVPGRVQRPGIEGYRSGIRDFFIAAGADEQAKFEICRQRIFGTRNDRSRMQRSRFFGLPGRAGSEGNGE